ncbi:MULTISPECIES: fumarylacetoacetate hydrolase family protein [Rhizobium]|uniref:2-hydroxyhepta-2,4-diene-1,7-dioate isomerase n=1 Tax=Rhizobium rhizogenes (strain K84 / ATCC BAA-868) TaxID=311403 RepID=B9JMM1_RHIR8|nr:MULTISPECIES: fumarylacetoacetate hydrolase family protein [Rhizobium]ACM28802.1 2-hydroxyhepta-2,4-diene-1,7-dioate isomerase [Rhizobium rhizogenes K84]NTI43793.1 fumarylacetoacetate hydrolase family protein [Rhizobium rhizogenes]OCJ18937.1 2-hydroxyhepta-2,4-diene-1,7-dioate isomerase [Agrobacterium sp. B131/95]
MSMLKLGSGRIDGSKMLLLALNGRIYRAADLLAGERWHDLTLDELLEHWEEFFPELQKALVHLPDPQVRPVEEAAIDWLPPIERPGKVVCIGTNYRDHLAEMRVAELPAFPYAFMRPAGSLNGHGKAVPVPDWPQMIDWEAELGFVVGRRARNVPQETALDIIAGYTVINDISARDWIESRPFVGVDWVMQKGWDGFQPTGPWLTPASLVPDPQNLAIRCLVNGVVKQDSNTNQMIFGVREIIAHLTKIMTLEPGDVIATGTPAGVGFGRQPREALRTGDIVRVEIEGLGAIENHMK